MTISIITPAFNAALTIEKTILSVLRQRQYIYEYIIIDGGSTDGTMAIVNKYKQFIDCVVSEKDKGIADAYNKGIGLATGDLIGIIAADDQLIMDAIPRIVDAYDGISDLVCGNIIDYNGIRFRRRKPNRDLKNLLKGTSIPHPAIFVRKDAYLKFGTYSLKYRCAIDREILLRFYKSGATFQFVDFDISLFASGSGISTFNPCKVAYPEDCKISIEYGVSNWKAIAFFWFSVVRYYIQSFFKRIIMWLHLERFFYRNLGASIDSVSKNDVEKLQIL